MTPPVAPSDSSQYMHMNAPTAPAESSQYMHMTPPMQRKPSSIASVSNSMTSINASQQDQIEHQRRPSQSVVLEHLIMEFGPERAKVL